MEEPEVKTQDAASNADAAQPSEDTGAEEPAAPSTEIQVEDLGPCKKKLVITVPKERVEKELEEKLIELRNTVAIPGFRRGKAPLRLLDKRFGKQIKEDVRESLAESELQEALKSHDLTPFGAPEVSAGELDAEEGFKLEVTVNVKPQFEVKDYAELQVEKPVSEVSDEEVEAVLNRMREQKAVLKPIGEDGLAEGDEVSADLTISGEGFEPREEEDVDFVLDGELEIQGVTIEGAAAALQGAKVGEEREAEGVAGDDFPVAEARGKPVKVRFRILDAKRKSLPELDDEFAKIYRCETLEELRGSIRSELESQKARAAEQVLRRNLQDALLAQYDFDLPEDVVEMMTEQIVQRTRRRLESQGVSPGELNERMEEMQNMGADQAKRELKLYLILEAIAEKEHLYVTEDEVGARLDAMARIYQAPRSRLERELEATGGLSSLRSEMRDQKTIEFLLDKVQIVEKKPSADEAENEAPQE